VRACFKKWRNYVYIGLIYRTTAQMMGFMAQKQDDREFRELDGETKYEIFLDHLFTKG